MAKVTITFTDDQNEEGIIRMLMEFEPSIKRGIGRTPAQEAAIEAVSVALYDYIDDENLNEINDEIDDDDDDEESCDE